MFPFKPVEVRIIVLLIILAVAGSAIELVGRQQKEYRLDLGIFSAPSQYPYRYNATPLTGAVSESTQIEGFLAVPEALPLNYKLDINQCGYFDIEKLPGIGSALAENIIAFRDSIGGFSNFEELDKIKGIGPAKLAMLKERIEIK